VVIRKTVFNSRLRTQGGELPGNLAGLWKERGGGHVRRPLEEKRTMLHSGRRSLVATAGGRSTARGEETIQEYYRSRDGARKKTGGSGQVTGGVKSSLWGDLPQIGDVAEEKSK